MSYRVLTVALTLLATCGVGSGAIAREPLPPGQRTLLAQAGGPTQPQATPGIQELQSRLATLGYYDGPVNGLFDAETRDALAAFQRDNGLVGTGILDPITRERLTNPESAQPNPGSENFVDPAIEAPSTPNPTASPNNPAAPATPPASVPAVPPIPEGTPPEGLAEPDGADNPAPLEDDAPPIIETPDSGSDTLEAEPIEPDQIDETDQPSNGGLSRLLVLGLVIMALGGLGTGLLLWLAKRGGSSANAPVRSTEAGYEAMPAIAHEPGAPGPRSPVKSSTSPSALPHNGRPSSTGSTEEPLVIEHRSLPLDLTPEPRMAKINIIDELIQDLNNPDPETRHKAIWELGQRGNSAAVHPLAGLLIEADSHEQGLILAALSEISIKTLKPMNRAVALALQDDNPEVRKNAIRDLARIYDSLGQVGRMLGHATADNDPEVRQTAHWALEQLNQMRFSANESAALLQESRDGVERLPEDGSAR